MNERILKLAEKAGILEENYPVSDRVASELQKFAELLVRECVLKIEDMIDNGWYADTGKLLEHFGIVDD